MILIATILLSIFFLYLLVFGTSHALFLLLCVRVIKAVYMKSVPIISGPQEYNKINLDGL